MTLLSSRLSARACYLASFVGALAIAAMGVALARATHTPSVAVAMSVAAAAWGLAYGAMAWRRIDETAREAQKSASLWGGSFGTLVALMACLTIPFFSDFWRSALNALDAHRGAWPSTTFAFIAGALFVGVAQSLGFVLAWAGWWVAKR